jgi:hypothetical protein
MAHERRMPLLAERSLHDVTEGAIVACGFGCRDSATFSRCGAAGSPLCLARCGTQPGARGVQYWYVGRFALVSLSAQAPSPPGLTPQYATALATGLSAS